MKTMTIFLIVLSFAFIFNPTTASNLKSSNSNTNTQAKNIIVDNGQANLQISQVVRRNPTVSIVENQTPVKVPESNTVSFSNSNSNNGGTSVLGKTATIVGNFIFF